MSQISNNSSIDPVPDLGAAQVLGKFFGTLRKELVDQGFSEPMAEQLVVSTSVDLARNCSITIHSVQEGAPA